MPPDYGPILKDWKYYTFWTVVLLMAVSYGSVIVYQLALCLRELRRIK